MLPIQPLRIEWIENLQEPWYTLSAIGVGWLGALLMVFVLYLIGV